MKNKIIILSLVFVVLVILFIPAKFVQNMIPANSPVELENMSGTIWSGKIERASSKSLFAEDINYQISWLPLLTATLSGSLDISSGDLTGSLDFSASDQDNFSVAEANLKVVAEKLASFIPFPGVQLDGEFSTDNLIAEVVDKKVVIISGLTSWNNASVTINKRKHLLGDFAIEWTTNQSDSVISGQLKKTKNELGLEGNLTLSGTGVAEFKGSISSAADRNLYTALALFADGKVKLGRLPIKFKKKIQ